MARKAAVALSKGPRDSIGPKINHKEAFLSSALRRTIFIVEDDPSLRLGLQRLLDQHGFEIEVFDSAEDFDERANLDRPHCLVLDITLKNRSGIDLRRELVGAGVSIPVIFITAHDCDITRKAAQDSGCVAYLTKPFLAKSLVGAINKAVELHPKPAGRQSPALRFPGARTH